MNVALIAAFTAVFALFWYVRRDLSSVEQALFPQVTLDDEARLREYNMM